MADFGLASEFKHVNTSLLRPVNSIKGFTTSPASVNLANCGGAIDGVTDDTDAIVNALNHTRFSGTGVQVGPGVSVTHLAPEEIVGRFLGEGQIQTEDKMGNARPRGRMFARRTTAPVQYGSQDGADTAFSGDLSTVHQAIEHRIDGPMTLTQPTTGYVVHAETGAVIHQFQNTSGWNALTNDQGGRTGVAFVNAHVAQVGQGDAMYTYVTGIIKGTKQGSTHFLANPAVLLWAGGLFAFADGTYQQVDEYDHNDAGFDVAVSSTVRNFARTNNKGAKGAWWLGTRYQSTGTVPVDVAFQVTGLWNKVLDTSSANLGPTGAAITLGVGHRIYLGATNRDRYANPAMIQPGPHWLDFNGASGKVELAFGGTAAIVVSAEGVEANLLRPVSNCYTASGDIAASDRLAVIDSDTLIYLALGAGPADGHEMIIKRVGDGPAVIKLPLDGRADSVVILGCCVLKEALGVSWSERQGSWLLISATPSAGAMLHVQYGDKRTRVMTTNMVADWGTTELGSACLGEQARLIDAAALVHVSRPT